MLRKLLEKAARSEKRSRRFGGQGFYPTYSSSAPVKKGQEIDAFINDIGSRGDGITSIHGFPTFLPKARVGESLKVRIVKVERRFAVAERLSEQRGPR